MKLRTLLVVCIAGVCVAGARRAEAQSAEDIAAAKTLFDDGNKLYNEGAFDKACPKFEGSLKLDPENIDTRGKLALCYEKQGKLASAWGTWRDLKKRAERANRQNAADIAKKHVEDLEPQLARITVQIKDTTIVGLVVTRDGSTVSPATYGSAIPVDKGKHVYAASAAGYKDASVEIEINDGESKTVEIPALEKLPEVVTPPGGGGGGGDGNMVQPPPPPRKVSGTRKYLGIGATATGGVLLGVGLYFGLDAMGKRDDAVTAGCNDDLSSCPDVGPGETALDKANAAYDSANLSTYLTIGGVVVAGAGLVLWLTAPSAPSERADSAALRLVPSVGPDSAGVFVTGGF